MLSYILVIILERHEKPTNQQTNKQTNILVIFLSFNFLPSGYTFIIDWVYKKILKTY